MAKKKSEILPKAIKYSAEMCNKLLDVAGNGGHVAQMCSALGIRSRDTFYRWIELYPEFKEAYEESKLLSQAFYEDVLLRGSLGQIKGFNHHSIAMILQNKFPDEYKSDKKSEITVRSDNSVEIDARIEKLQKLLDDSR